MQAFFTKNLENFWRKDFSDQRPGKSPVFPFFTMERLVKSEKNVLSSEKIKNPDL